MVRRIAISVFLMFAVAGTGLAQDWAGRGMLRGVVLDKSTGEPIKGAVIVPYWKEEGNGPDKPLKTDKKGRFKTVGLRPGYWNLLVDAEGYRGWGGQAMILSQGADIQEIELEPLPKEYLEAIKRQEAGKIVEEANEFMESGDWAKAREIYKKSLAEVGDGDKAPILVGIAQTYVNEKNFEDATTALNQAIGFDPENAAANRLYAAIAVEKDDLVTAEAYLLKIPLEEKIQPNTMLNIGLSYFNEGNMDKADYWISRTLSLYPDIGICYYYRGLVMLQKPDNDQAIADFEKFIELEPEDDKVAEAKEFLGYLRENG